MPSIAIAEAAASLEDLGFVDIHGDRPWEPGAARLLVALRERPQLTHFDPEWVGYWHAVDDRCRMARLDRTTQLPVDEPFRWGTIRFVDRLAVANAFLSFGGRLQAEALDATTTIAIFSSPAPIARWTGHSQAPDPLAERIGAFFGRLMIPVDFEPGFESRLAALRPLVIYAAMLADWRSELAGSALLRDVEPAASHFLRTEIRRLQEADGDAWRDGEALAAEPGVGS
ncbi:MAG: hypothetical protein ACHQ15_04680 [Candidatus Limnocylindrales bacterium]